MSIFESIERALFGDSEEELERKRLIATRKHNQLGLITQPFEKNRKVVNMLERELDRRGGFWRIFVNYKQGKVWNHARFPYFQDPIPGDITVDDIGRAYEYNRSGTPVLLDSSDYAAGCYYMKLKSGKLFKIDRKVLYDGTDAMEGETLADYYERTGASVKEEYEKRKKRR